VTLRELTTAIATVLTATCLGTAYLSLYVAFLLYAVILQLRWALVAGGAIWVLYRIGVN
jgi:hypothetical protein